MIRRAMVVLAALALSPLSAAFTRQQAADDSKSRRQTLIRAARLLDVRGGNIINNAAVLVEGERIAAVGAGLSAPAGADVIDLSDVTLLPGLIDCHTHLLASSADDYGEMLLTKSQAYRALEGAANARRTLLAGFTAVRDVENEGSGYADVALRDAINRGLAEGPRMKVATRAVAATGQYNPFGISPDLPDFPRGAQMVSGVEEARRAVREQIGNGADLIKVYADWEYPTLTPEELRVVVEEAHKARRRVAAHATTKEGIRNAVEAGVDSVEHGWGADRETLELMKQKGVWLVPTQAPIVKRLAEAQDERGRQGLGNLLARIRETVRAAREIGVKVATGSDPANEPDHGANAREIIALRDAGYTSLEAIRAATIAGAELLGWQDQLGALERGKFADLIAVPGDPLSDIRELGHVRFVMKGGIVVKDESRVSSRH